MDAPTKLEWKISIVTEWLERKGYKDALVEDFQQEFLAQILASTWPMFLEMQKDGVEL